MRPLLLSDLDWAVRALLACPEAGWIALSRQLLNEAETAESTH